MCCLDWTQWKRECRQNECGRLACRSMRRLLSSVIKLIIAGAGLLDAIVGANAIVTYQVALFIVVACVPVREVRTIQEHGEL
jgi:serine acetyltransferase